MPRIGGGGCWDRGLLLLDKELLLCGAVMIVPLLRDGVVRQGERIVEFHICRLIVNGVGRGMLGCAMYRRPMEWG